MKNPRHKRLICPTLVRGGLTLRLRCKVADGWRTPTGLYCFKERCSSRWFFDLQTRVSVSVRPNVADRSSMT